MNAGTKCALVLINYLVLCLAETYGFGFIGATSSAQERKRAPRQSGYVYDRPTISFNLPSRDIPVTSTQASPVDRTVMQMYYAYPAPASGTALSVGSNAAAAGYRSGSQSGGATSRGTVGSSSATESGAYNYGAPNDVSAYGRGSISQTNQQKVSLVTSGATLSSGGYNYGSRAVLSEGGSPPKINQVGVASTLSNSGGYMYSAPDAAGNSKSPLSDRETSLADVVSKTDSVTSGYNYGTQTNIVKASQGAGSLAIPENTLKTNSGPDGSTGSTGYNYKNQITTKLQTGQQEVAAISADGSTGIDTTSRSNGYNYEVQKENRGVSMTSTIPDTSGYSVKSAVQSMTAVSVSTNAPQYLPPTTNANNINVLNNNLNSGAAVTAQSDVYLPPSIPNTPTLITTQTVSNKTPETNIAPSDSYLPPLVSNDGITKSLSSSKPVAGSNVYIPPVSLNPSGVIETTSTFEQSSQNSVAPISEPSISLNPKNTYLQPSTPTASSNENMQSLLSASNQPQTVPSTNYLPPIPTSREINQLVSTPAATYLPPVL